MRSEALATPANDDQAPYPLPPPARIQELLFDAARLGRIDVIPALIRAGADVAALDANGYTPLILACYHGHDTVAAYLLESGASLDQGDRSRGNTALMGAAFKDSVAITRLLLDAGANPDAVNGAGQTALMFAALCGRSAIVGELLAFGADPHRLDAAGNSAISVARSQGNEPMAARLLAHH